MQAPGEAMLELIWPAHLAHLPSPLGPGPIGLSTRLGPGPVWAQGAFGPRAHWAQGPGLGGGAGGRPMSPWAHGLLAHGPCPTGPLYGSWALGPWALFMRVFRCYHSLVWPYHSGVVT